MRISFHCKRFYTGKDVIRDGFGRLYEIPFQLAQHGHEVRAYVLNYRDGRPDEVQRENMSSGSLMWTSRSLGGNSAPFRMASTRTWLYRQLSDFTPDVIIGASDIPNAWLARWLSKEMRVPYVVDLYDNFESFGQARIPGFRHALKLAVRDADLVMTVSSALAKKAVIDYQPKGQTFVMPNGVRKTVFFRGSTRQAREHLGLPLDAKLVGTAGGLSRMKGMATVYSAWEKLRPQHREICLVLAGPIEAGFPVPSGPRVIYLGQLAEEQVSQLFRALDVGIIAVPDSEFGRYCFPQKTFEMLACGLPVVVSDVGASSELFRDWPHVLFKPGDVTQLVDAIERQLESPEVPDVSIRDWSDLVRSLEPAIAALAQKQE